MSNLKVCRICLCKDAKVYTYDRYHLKQYYEEIMAKKVYEEDGLPNYFCYECAAILYKFHKFKEKCWTGEKALQELLWSGSITLSSISQIDRQDKNLKSTIDIISGRKRVRTYIVKHKTLSKNLLNEAKTVEIPEEECKVDYNSDNSLDDQNFAEIKNEMNNEEAVDDKNLAEKNNEMNNEKTDYSIEEDEKSNMDIEINPEEKTTLDLEDERMFTDGEDSHSDSLPSAEHPVTKEEINNRTGFEQKDIINSDNEIVLNKNHKKQIRKKTGKAKIDLADNKAKKFEVNNTDQRLFLDPTHWLKINLTEEEALEEFRARARDRKYASAAYQCTDCFKGFSKEDMLNRHIKITHNESVGPVVCRFCNMRFKWKCYLTTHIAQHYTKYKCLRCDLICPLRGTALFHNDYHNGVVKKCKHCEEEFRHQSTYYTHLRTHHRSEYVCTLCGSSFVSNKGLNKHKRAMHINTVVNPEEEEGNTYCERCDVKFETWTAYQEHVFHSAKHTEGVEGLAFEIPAPSIPKRKKRNRARKPRKITSCTFCNKTFRNITVYMKHHAAEHKDEPLPPREAPKEDPKEEERHICEICGSLLKANSIASHVNTHTRENLYTCSTCGMQFNSKSSMNRHQLTHTGEKKYKCTMCDKRFQQKCSMKLHLRTFHLKEPYPKRNRKKKNDDMFMDEDSDDNMTLDKFFARKY